MNRTIRPVSRAKAAKSRISSSLRPRTSTTFTLSGASPAASAASMAARTTARSPRRRIAANRSARSESQLTFTRRSPAPPAAGRRVAPAASRWWSWRGRRSPRSPVGPRDRDSPRRTSGSPPVSRTEVTPSAAGHRRHPDDLVEGEQCSAGQEGHAVLGHAVDAAEVAPVGDRDAQVVVDPAVGVDQRAARSAWPRPGPRAVRAASPSMHRVRRSPRYGLPGRSAPPPAARDRAG